MIENENLRINKQLDVHHHLSMAICRIRTLRDISKKSFLSVSHVRFHNMINDLFFHFMDVIDKSAKMSNETFFINKMAGIKRYKTANFEHDTTGIS